MAWIGGLLLPLGEGLRMRVQDSLIRAFKHPHPALCATLPRWGRVKEEAPERSYSAPFDTLSSSQSISCKIPRGLEGREKRMAEISGNPIGPGGFQAGVGERVRLMLRAFRYRNYALFFGGQCVSLIGSWMQIVAMSWLVYRMTNSAFLLGLVGFLGQIPALLLMPFAGVFADRWNRRSLLVATQTAAMLQAFVLALLVLD